MNLNRNGYNNLILRQPNEDRRYFFTKLSILQLEVLGYTVEKYDDNHIKVLKLISINKDNDNEIGIEGEILDFKKVFDTKSNDIHEVKIFSYMNNGKIKDKNYSIDAISNGEYNIKFKNEIACNIKLVIFKGLKGTIIDLVNNMNDYNISLKGIKILANYLNINHIGIPENIISDDEFYDTLIKNEFYNYYNGIAAVNDVLVI